MLITRRLPSICLCLKSTGIVFFAVLLMSAQATAKTPVVATYYVASGNPSAVSNLPAEKLTHVLYAFIAICGDNSAANPATIKAIDIACEGKEKYSAVLFNEQDVIQELNAFRALKQKHPHLKLLPSIGGWTLSQPFHELVKNQDSLEHFVSSALALIAKHDVFDGIDIDWEYPGGGGNAQAVLSGAQAKREKLAFSLMMKKFREGLHQLQQNTGREYLLTAAVSGLASKVQAIDWKVAIPYMDYVFAMTYDFAVGDGYAAHHTNVFSADANTLSAEMMINNLLSAGVPAQKLAIGVAFYGRAWQNSGWQSTNLGGAFTDSSQSLSSGTYIYKDLSAKSSQGYSYGYDEAAQAAFLYNPSTDDFISFDDKRSILAKTKLAREKGIAGVFSWQILQDNGELINAMHLGMNSKLLPSEPITKAQ